MLNKVSIDPSYLPLCEEEYVLARINIGKTLAAVFYNESKYHNTPGTFAVDDEAAVARCWHLVHRFLAMYIVSRDENTREDLPCPFFVPKPYLMLVQGVFGSAKTSYRATLRPTWVTTPDSSRTTWSSLADFCKLAYEDVGACATQSANSDALMTDGPLLDGRYVVYQDVYAKLACTVGSVKDGLMVRLLDSSIERLDALNLRAALQAEDFADKHLPLTSCRCSLRTKNRFRQSFATLDDIVVDFERCVAGSTPATLSDTDLALGFEEESHRLMVLIDDWLGWLYESHCHIRRDQAVDRVGKNNEYPKTPRVYMDSCIHTGNVTAN